MVRGREVKFEDVQDRSDGFGDMAIRVGVGRSIVGKTCLHISEQCEQPQIGNRLGS